MLRILQSFTQEERNYGKCTVSFAFCDAGHKREDVLCVSCLLLDGEETGRGQSSASRVSVVCCSRAANSCKICLKIVRSAKRLFHLRPLAFGEIIIFTPTSGSLSKKSSIFCTPLRPKVARPKIPYFCVGPDGNIRAENVSHPTREGCDGYVVN